MRLSGALAVSLSLSAIGVPSACGRACGGGGGGGGDTDGGPVRDAGTDGGASDPGTDGGPVTDAGTDGGASDPDPDWPDQAFIANERRFDREVAEGKADIVYSQDGSITLHRSFEGGIVVAWEWSVNGHLFARFDIHTQQTRIEWFDPDGGKQIALDEELVPDAEGLRRRHTEFHSDGPDVRTLIYWTDDKDELILLKTQQDELHSGSWIEVDSTSVSRYSPTINFANDPKSDPSGKCMAGLSDTLDRVVRKLQRCLAGMDSNLSLTIIASIKSAGTVYTLTCAPNSLGAPGYYDDKTRTIFIDPVAAADPAYAVPTLFHELLHTVEELTHHQPDPTTGNPSGYGDPADRVYGCERACFGTGGNPPTSLDCAQCRGTRMQGDRVCGDGKRFKQVACPTDVVYCCLGGGGMPLDQCVKACNPGLKCLAPVCGPVAPSGPCRGP